MKRFTSFLLALCLSLVPLQTTFAMTSANYQVNWDTFSDGGLDNSTSTNFTVRDTLGNQGVGTSTSANYQLSAGYRVIETGQTLSLFVRSQDNTTKVAYSAFSNGGKTVTVSSAASYAIGDIIAVIENGGFSQLVAVGKITNIAGSVLTVDAWSGDNASMSASPSGGDDFVYRMSGSSAAFGSVAAGTQNAATAISSVLADAPTGFTVYTQANQILQNGSAQAITTVTDGAVSVGSEEYGASVTGPSAVGAGDLGVTTTQRAIQSTGSATASNPDRVAMVYKLSITGTTNAGSYSQNVFYTLTANF